MSVRAKFKVETKDEADNSVRLRAVTADSAENKQFFQATPSGTIELQTVNPAALAQFEQGAEYYVDFEKA